MIRHDIDATSQADAEAAVAILAAIEGSEAATSYRDAALETLRQAVDGPPELWPAAEQIAFGLCGDGADAVIAARPDLALDRMHLAAYLVRQVGAIAAYGEHGAVVLDQSRILGKTDRA